MADRQQRITTLAITLALVGLNLIAFNFLIAGWSGARLDLTEEGVFSISDATRRILGSLDEDLVIYGYFSKRTHPKLAPLIPEIVDMLEEYRAVAGGRVQVEIIDPMQDEEAAQEAADRYGVQSMPFRLASKYESGIVNAHFALVIKYGDRYERYGFQDLVEFDSLPSGDLEIRLRNLEYDLTRAVKKVVYGFRTTNELFERIDGNVRLTAIMTPDALPEMFNKIPDAMRTAADELREKGGDKFIYEELDPFRDEAIAQEVQVRFGARPMSLGLFGGEQFYLYGLLQVGDQLEQLILSDGELTAAAIRETVESSLRRNTPGFLKTVGVSAPTPPQIPPQLRMQMPPQPPPEFEEIKRFLAEDFQVKDVQLGSPGGVPSDVDMLLVLKPTAFGEEELYNLDQYLMRGGRVVIAAGNYDPDFNAQGLSVTPHATGLDDWLSHHGVSLGRTLVLDDRNQPLPIPELVTTALGTLRSWRLEPYPYLVQVREDGFVNPDITATLDAVGIYWGSPVIVDPEAASHLEVLPILKSSDVSWTSDDLSQVSYTSYEVPAGATESQTLAVALTGRFKSYFADREVPFTESAADAGETDAAAPAMPTTVALTVSPETRLVVVGNAEFLSDFVARAIGQMEGGFFVENLTFMENVLDWISLDNDMLEIRARGLASRRLDSTDRGTEITIETINYLVPVAVLVIFGLNVRRRRRRTPSLIGSGPAATPRNPTPVEQ